MIDIDYVFFVKVVTSVGASSNTVEKKIPSDNKAGSPGTAKQTIENDSTAASATPNDSIPIHDVKKAHPFHFRETSTLFFQLFYSSPHDCIILIMNL